MALTGFSCDWKALLFILCFPIAIPSWCVSLVFFFFFFNNGALNGVGKS